MEILEISDIWPVLMLVSPAVVVAIVAAIVRWPVLENIGQFAFFAAWGAVTPGVFLFVAFAVHLPASRYAEAGFALAVGALISIPWFLVAGNAVAVHRQRILKKTTPGY